MSKLTFKLDHFAEIEFNNIIDYYKQLDKSLSADFIYEFDQSIKNVKAFPKAGNNYLHGTKRIILKRFPYAIVYKLYNNVYDYNTCNHAYEKKTRLLERETLIFETMVKI